MNAVAQQIGSASTTQKETRSARRLLKLLWSGNVTVPSTYNMRTLNGLEMFLKGPLNSSPLRMRDHDKRVVHGNYSNPQHVLSPGDRLNVRFYMIAGGHHLTPVQCHEFWKKHNSLFPEAQTLSMMAHAVANGQINVADIACGFRLVPPCERFSSDVVANEAPFMYVGTDSAMDIGVLCPNTDLDDGHALIVLERFAKR